MCAFEYVFYGNPYTLDFNLHGRYNFDMKHLSEDKQFLMYLILLDCHEMSYEDVLESLLKSCSSPFVFEPKDPVGLGKFIYRMLIEIGERCKHFANVSIS